MQITSVASGSAVLRLRQRNNCLIELRAVDRNYAGLEGYGKADVNSGRPGVLVV